MGLFKSGKTLPERAQEEQAKLQMMKTKVAQTKTQRELVEEQRKNRDALRRLTA